MLMFPAPQGLFTQLISSANLIRHRASGMFPRRMVKAVPPFETVFFFQPGGNIAEFWHST